MIWRRRTSHAREEGRYANDQVLGRRGRQRVFYALATAAVILGLVATVVVTRQITTNEGTGVTALQVAKSARQTARAADRAAQAASEAQSISTRLGVERRRDLAQTDYGACLRVERLGRQLGGLIHVSLSSSRGRSRRQRRPGQRRFIRRFRRTERQLARGLHCARLPSMRLLPEAERRGIVRLYH